MSTKFIASALDAGNYTLALKLATEECKKKPSSVHTAQRLNILSHLEPERCLKELDELVSSTPSDPEALKLIVQTYQNLGKTAPNVFENATRKYGSGSLILEWNNTCIAQSDYLNFQKSSMLLKKLIGTKTDPSSQSVRFRAIASIVIACNSVGELRLDQSKRKLFAMIGIKLIEESTLKELDAHQMFLNVQLLLILGDHKSVVTKLEPFLQKERDLTLLLIYFDSLKELENWQQLKEETLKYLNDVDDWDTWKLTILSCKKLNQIDYLKTSLSNYKQGRNLSLVKIEIEDDLSSKLASIENYLTQYLHKPCCFQDLRLIISNLPYGDVMKTVQSQFNLNYKAQTVKDLIISVNYIKFKAFLIPDIMKQSNFTEECWKLYNETYHLLQQLPDYDFHYGYELIILIIQSMIIQAETFTTELVIRMIIILEWALKDNKYEFHIKLWLINLYKLIGQSGLAIQHHADMKIKNIQLDTIGIQTLNNISSSSLSLIGFLSFNQQEGKLISNLMLETDKFYSQSAKRELYPSIMQCLDLEVWEKFGSFLDFQNRINNSLSKFYLTLEQLRISRLKNEEMSNSLLESKIDILKKCYLLSLNEDVSDDVNVDTDFKINNNIDDKTIWDCGTHDQNINDVKSKLMNTITVERVKTLTYVQLLIYEPNSLMYNELIEKLQKASLSEFTEIEKWSINTIVSLLTKKEPSSVPAAPRDIINWKFINYYSSILDLTKMLDLIIRSPHKGLNTKDIKKFRKTYCEVFRKALVRCSDIKKDTRIEFQKHFNTSINWFDSVDYINISSDDVKFVAKKLDIDI